MAYASRFRFDFTSRDGVDCAIDVLADGYTGIAAPRAVGGTVTLRRSKSGRIIGTSLTWTAECAEESEFADLYTSDPKQFKVELYRPYLIWSGYITPELYSEPMVAPPYDVSLTADDRIAELKLNEFEKQGAVAVYTLLTYLLAPSASSRVIFMSSLKNGATDLAGLRVNLDHMEGESYYDVLAAILETFNAVIWFDGAAQTWVVCRENDAAALAGSDFRSVGSLDPTVPTQPDFFPVGNMTAEVVPAKRRYIVTANMGERVRRMPTDGWYAVSPSSLADGKLTITGGSYVRGVENFDNSLNGGYQAPSFTLKFTTVTGRTHDALRISVAVLVDFKTAAGVVRRFLNKDGGWQTTWPAFDDNASTVGNETPVISVDPTRVEDLEFNFALPAEIISDDLSKNLKVTDFLSIYIYLAAHNDGSQSSACLTDVRLERSDSDLPQTATTTVIIGNGAREDASADVELSNLLPGEFLNTAGVGTFTSAAVAAGLSLDDFIAVDHALSVCVPRLRVSGTLHGRATPMTSPPVFLNESYVQAMQHSMMIEESNYDIIEGDLGFTALTFPSAALTYESLTRDYIYANTPVTASGLVKGGARSMSGRGSTGATTRTRRGASASRRRSGD